jgi:hypothetical protein
VANDAHTDVVISDLPDPLTWIALGPFDVDPEELRGAGRAWDEVVPDDVDNRIDESIGALPESGWRELTMQPHAPARTAYKR